MVLKSVFEVNLQRKWPNPICEVISQTTHNAMSICVIPLLKEKNKNHIFESDLEKMFNHEFSS